MKKHDGNGAGGQSGGGDMLTINLRYLLNIIRANADIFIISYNRYLIHQVNRTASKFKKQNDVSI